jgi:hypothetical protein
VFTVKVSEIFDGLLENLKVDNRPTIAARRDEIAKALNKDFRAVDGSTKYQFMIGSYGRGTAIRGISDLDMLYILPAAIRDKYEGDSGPRRVMERTRAAIRSRYPATDVRVDQCVVVVQFKNFKFEVQPVFENSDRSFSYPDTYSETWKITKPRAEIDALREHDIDAGRNLRRLCKMVRAWKNEHGIVMGGLLIDTLVDKFFQSTEDYDEASTSSYDLMARDLFKFLSEEDDHEFYAAVGSRQRVRVKKRFQRKAKRAHELCLEAIAAAEKSSANKKWKAVFGRPVPSSATIAASAEAYSFRNTEEFIEDYYPVDVRYGLTIDCNVTQDGFRTRWLREMLSKRILLKAKKKLDFSISSTDVQQPYIVKWKVLNRGEEAERRDTIRGRSSSLTMGRADGRKSRRSEVTTTSSATCSRTE